MKYSRISGTGSYLPEKVLTNHDIEKFVDTSDEWIQERTGIKSRHIAADGETATDMAAQALQRALENSGKTAQDLDLIIVATCTAHCRFPSIATQLQNIYKVKNFPAFDLNAACSGFIYGLNLVDTMVRSGQVRCAAVIGTEHMSSLIDWSDRSTCVLFGDGAGAVIVEPSNEAGIISTHIHADGAHMDLLYHDAASGKIVMEGNKVFRVAVKTLERIVDETLDANKLDRSAVDWLLPHQANLRIMLATAQKLDMTEEQVIITVDEHGNTSAASIPLALDVGIARGQIKRGEVLMMESFGAGFTWGSALVRY
ncbi:MAG: ketoacyl-ACP synthase III [Gammaproteobacteria bacterium]|nr:ketoacyl-ACP synthase III [Gammaproteobacteria bacterium]